MCGHGTIGVAETLAYLGRIGPGTSYLETPVGVVSFDYHGNHRVTVENVPSYRHACGVRVHAEPYGDVTGDVAWGGNWFFLVGDHGQELEPRHTGRLLALTEAIRRGLVRQGVTGVDGAEIDHVELFGPPHSMGADSRNFVLCPGGAYDRSPCGTGTSAKLACLAADGKLREGQVWRQESILGSVFEATYRTDGDKIIPRITGSAYVNGEATLILDPDDPFAMGIRG
jgi:4-hydroxyproline epimerase